MLVWQLKYQNTYKFSCKVYYGEICTYWGSGENDSRTNIKHIYLKKVNGFCTCD